jgi:hypothetical protein
MSVPKVHYAAFLDSSTSCGLTLQWKRLREDEPRKAHHNGKPMIVSRLDCEVTCNSCWKSCA